MPRLVNHDLVSETIDLEVRVDGKLLQSCGAKLDDLLTRSGREVATSSSLDQDNLTLEWSDRYAEFLARVRG